MLLTLIIILILIGAAVIGSIYSNFIVFYSNFFESENYHKAYYASISALERGELVTKQRSPGYVGSGGFVMGEGTGSYNNGGADENLSGFSYLGYNNDESSVFWTINSRTTRIPSISGGDVERMLSTGDAVNYNMMGYENSEVFLLYYDKSDDNPYQTGTIAQSTPGAISGIIRLPKLLSGSWGEKLDVTKPLAGSNVPKDDAIVDWQIRGNIGGDSFTIYSTQKTRANGINVDYGNDSIFRESDINNPLIYKFGNSKDVIQNGDPNNMGRGNNAELRYISNVDNMNWSNANFEDVFRGTSGGSLRFSLLNLLKTNNGYIYPFLEYYAEFYDQYGNPAKLSDKYYTIDAEGNFKDYQVNTIIQKPTVKESVLSNFTSVF